MKMNPIVFTKILVVASTIVGFYYVVSTTIQAPMVIDDEYHRLSLESTREQVDQTMGREPDLVVHFSKRDVLYYGSVGLKKWLTGRDIGKYKEVLVESIEDLPYIYGSVQILIDTDSNKVLAKTMNGEERNIHTTLGVFPGASYDRIPRDLQTQLFGFEQEYGQVEYLGNER